MIQNLTKFEQNIWFLGVLKNIFWSLFKTCSFYWIGNPEFLILQEKLYIKKIQLSDIFSFWIIYFTLCEMELWVRAIYRVEHVVPWPPDDHVRFIKDLMALIPSTQTSLVGNSQATTLCNSWATTTTTTPAGVELVETATAFLTPWTSSSNVSSTSI
jgi:hypothetical protein